MIITIILTLMMIIIITRWRNLLNFVRDIWEKDYRTPEMPWMESVSEQLRDNFWWKRLKSARRGLKRAF